MTPAVTPVVVPSAENETGVSLAKPCAVNVNVSAETSDTTVRPVVMPVPVPVTYMPVVMPDVSPIGIVVEPAVSDRLALDVLVPTP